MHYPLLQSSELCHCCHMAAIVLCLWWIGLWSVIVVFTGHPHLHSDKTVRMYRDNCYGVQVHLPENSSGTLGFLFFLVLNLFYSFTEVVQWLFQRKLLFSKVSDGFRWGPTLQGGGNFFLGWGFQMQFSIETHITCDFPGGPDPLSPFWICTCDFTT